MTKGDITRIFLKSFVFGIFLIGIYIFVYTYFLNVRNFDDYEGDMLVDDTIVQTRKNIKTLKNIKQNKNNISDTNIDKEIEEALTYIKKEQIRKEEERKRKELEKFNKEKKEILIKLVSQAINKTKHASALTISYKKLCNYYPSYCKVIDIEDSKFTEEDKIYYTALTIYLIKFLNNIFPDMEEKIYYIKIQDEKIGRRGYSGHHSIVLNIKKDVSYSQFLEVLTHEIGHLVDLGVIKGNSFLKNPNYTEFNKITFSNDDPSIKFYKLSWQSEKIRKPYVYANDFVSGYALTDIFEDFAETFNMYINHNYVFKQMAKESNILEKKYNYMDNLLKGNFLNSDKKYHYIINYRPRDSTKLK